MENTELKLDSKSIQGFKRLFSLLDPDTLTKEQFLEFARNVIDFVKKTDARNIKEFNDIKEAFEKKAERIISKLNDDNALNIDGLKQKLSGSLSDQMEKMNKEYQGKMYEMETKILNLKDGKDADEVAILNSLKSQIKIPTIEELKDDLPRMGAEIRDALELLQGDERLNIDAIKGLQELLDQLKNRASVVGGGGNRYLDNLANVNPTGKANGSVLRWDSTLDRWVPGVISGGGGVETPTGTINGVNKTFTVTTTPLFITYNGQTMYENSGYTLSSLTITMTDAPETGSVLRSHY